MTEENRYYIDPKTLSPLQVHAIQILAKYGKPAPITSGVVHCGKACFRLQTAMELTELGIMYKTTTYLGESYTLSKVGIAIAYKVEKWKVGY